MHWKKEKNVKVNAHTGDNNGIVSRVKQNSIMEVEGMENLWEGIVNNYFNHFIDSTALKVFEYGF